MKIRTMRHLIVGLLTGTGVFHLLVAFLNAAPGLGPPLAGFGFLFVVIGFFVRNDTNDGSKSHSRNAIIAAIAACSAGLILGGRAYFANGHPPALILMFAIDIAVIVLGVMWLLKVAAKRRR